MDLSSLRELIPLMRESGVYYFKSGDLELRFSRPPKKTKTMPAVTSPIKTSEAIAGVPSAEESKDPIVPQALDGEMNFDKILNWSAPVDSGPVPLTDDAPLGDPTVEASNV